MNRACQLSWIHHEFHAFKPELAAVLQDRVRRRVHVDVAAGGSVDPDLTAGEDEGRLRASHE